MVEWIALSGSFAALALLHGRLLRRVRRIEKLSLYDPATGLLSGRYLETVALPDAIRDYAVGSVVFVDLDNFGEHNRRGYREGGDKALCLAADAVRRACRRSTDRAYRLHTAGDEFVVLMPNARRRDATDVTRALLRNLQESGVPASVGVFTWDDERHSRCNATQALKVAEDLMRVAKRAGGNLACFGNEHFVPNRLKLLSGWASVQTDSSAVPHVVADEVTVANP